MPKERFSCAAMEETKYLIEKPLAEDRKEMKRGVEFPGHSKVKAAIQRPPAMLHQNQMSGCLPCQNGTVKNPQTRSIRNGTCSPPPAGRRVRTSELTPTRPDTPPPTPASTSTPSRPQPSEIGNLPVGYTYSHTALPCEECFEDDEDTEHDTDFHPVMLTDDS
jgi:hypothetical protein